MIFRIIVALVGVLSIALPASAWAAPPPGPPPPMPQTVTTDPPPQIPPPTTAPSATPPAPQASTIGTAPHLRVSCKRHSNRRWSCAVRTNDSNNPVARCSGNGRVTASHRAACREKALENLGFGTASFAKAAAVDATREPPFLICGDSYTPGPYSDIQITHPVIVPRDQTQDGWVAFYARVLWWDGSNWRNYLASDGRPIGSDDMYHWYSADIFNQARQDPELDWIDARTGISGNGSWKWTVPKGYYWSVRLTLVWFPQPSYPYLASMPVSAHQTAWALNPGDTFCKLGA